MLLARETTTKIKIQRKFQDLLIANALSFKETLHSYYLYCRGHQGRLQILNVTYFLCYFIISLLFLSFNQYKISTLLQVSHFYLQRVIIMIFTYKIKTKRCLTNYPLSKRVVKVLTGGYSAHGVRFISFVFYTFSGHVIIPRYYWI